MIERFLSERFKRPERVELSPLSAGLEALGKCVDDSNQCKLVAAEQAELDLAVALGKVIVIDFKSGVRVDQQPAFYDWEKLGWDIEPSIEQQS